MVLRAGDLSGINLVFLGRDLILVASTLIGLFGVELAILGF